MLLQNLGIEKVRRRLPNKSRFRFFLFFVLISFSFWTNNKLSKEYQLTQSFFVKWIEVPKGIVLTDDPAKINLMLNTKIAKEKE